MQKKINWDMSKDESTLVNEPSAVYGSLNRNSHAKPILHSNKVNRLSVDEYFDKVRSVLVRKYENLQS